MTTLSDFLLAQIAEDEAVAREADAADIQTVPHEHVARWNPARVLAECESKRRIVVLHSDIDPCDAHDGATMETVPCETLRLLALPYADRPGWREEWRP